MSATIESVLEADAEKCRQTWPDGLPVIGRYRPTVAASALDSRTETKRFVPVIRDAETDWVIKYVPLCMTKYRASIVAIGMVKEMMGHD